MPTDLTTSIAELRRLYLAMKAGSEEAGEEYANMLDDSMQANLLAAADERDRLRIIASGRLTFMEEIASALVGVGDRETIIATAVVALDMHQRLVLAGAVVEAARRFERRGGDDGFFLRTALTAWDKATGEAPCDTCGGSGMLSEGLGIEIDTCPTCNPEDDHD